MIYLKSDDGAVKIIILETANLEAIKAGKPVKTPDGLVIIAWTPDPVWLADKIMDCNGDTATIGKLVDEGAKRPEKSGPRPTHGMHEHRFPETK